MKALLAIVAIMALVAACGDNSRVCGPGTIDVDGFCEAGTQPQICGDGTILDEATGDCVVDPSVCGEGTVLIDGQCRDPGTDVVVDLLEALEPNGFEPDATPAGIIELKPAGDPYVIHGCVQPVDTDTPDYDRYFLTVSGPTLIHVSADGVGGLAAGFVVRSSDPELADWQRIGLSLATDTSVRDVLLPKAGTYDVIFTDSRTLFPLTQGSTAEPAAGDLEGHSCYYATLVVRPIVPVPFDPATGVTGTIADALGVFSATFATGFTQMSAVIDRDGGRAAAALVALNVGKFAAFGDAIPGDPVAQTVFGSAAGDGETIVVLDYVWSMAIGPVPFEVTVDASIASKPLPTDGTAIADTSRARTFTGPLANVNLFHFDVAGDATTLGIDLSSTIQLQGSLVDDGVRVVSKLTGLTGSATNSTTFNGYRGLVRARKPGRHYLMVFAPRNAIGTAFSITSRIEAQNPEAVDLDIPLVDKPVGAFNSDVVTYDGSFDRWQRWNASGTGTGALAVTWFDETTTFGRLDDLAIRTGGGAGVASILAADCGAACDLAANDVQHRVTFPATGAGPVGRILADPATLAPVPTQFLVKVNPTIASGNRTFTLDFALRSYHDFDRLAPTEVDSVAGQTIDATVRERLYYLETDPGNQITITVTPTGTPATLDAAIVLLAPDETATRVVDASAQPVVETLTTTQAGGGFTAFKVRGGTAAAAGAFTIDVKIDPP